MCRQAPFHAGEVFRVLKPKGIFLTQQVGEDDKQNIKEVFGRGQSFGEEPGSFVDKCIRELEDAGFKTLRKDTYNATEYYADMTDLIFLLKNTPITPSFDTEKDQTYLKQIEEKYRTEDGIQTNSSRFLIISTKP